MEWPVEGEGAMEGWIEFYHVRALIRRIFCCRVCSQLLQRPIYECIGKNTESRLGHLACAGCIGKLPGGKCPGCEYGGVFQQGERALLGMRFKCHNDGCRTMRSYFLELIEHETVCPHALKGA